MYALPKESIFGIHKISLDGCSTIPSHIPVRRALNCGIYYRIPNYHACVNWEKCHSESKLRVRNYGEREE